MKNKWKLNSTLCELLLGIFIFGILCEVVLLIFLEDKLYYSIGLGIGIIVAGLMAVHMNYTLKQALEYDERNANKKIVQSMILRYTGVLLILAGTAMLNFASPLTLFLGIMGLKISAYLQPFTHRLTEKLSKEETE